MKNESTEPAWSGYEQDIPVEQERANGLENVTCAGLSNADERHAALDKLNELGDAAFVFEIGGDIIRAALQSPQDNPIEPISFVCWEENGVRLKTRNGEFIVTTPKQSPRVPVIDDKQAMEEYFKELYGIPMSAAFRQWDNEKIAQNFIHGWKAARAYAELQKGV